MIEQKSLEDHIRSVEGNIWLLYFKEDIKQQRKRDLETLFTFDRNHEAIDSYIKYLTESIIEPGQENDQDFISKIRKYKEACIANIKPEEIINFHNDLRIWCAYHKVGEFTPKNTSWHSKIWYEREDLKTKMFECFKDDLKYEKDLNGEFKKDANGEKIKTSNSFRLKEFNVIRDKLYRIFQAIEYLKTENFKEKEYLEITKDWGESVIERINPEKRKDFELLFRKYRYLGGKGEFNRDNILNSRFYNQMYAYNLKNWNKIENGSFTGNIAKEFAKTTAGTFAVEFMFIVSGLMITELSALIEIKGAALNQACQLGDPNACIALKDLLTPSIFIA